MSFDSCLNSWFSLVGEPQSVAVSLVLKLIFTFDSCMVRKLGLVDRGSFWWEVVAPGRCMRVKHI